MKLFIILLLAAIIGANAAITAGPTISSSNAGNAAISLVAGESMQIAYTSGAASAGHRIVFNSDIALLTPAADSTRVALNAVSIASGVQVFSSAAGCATPLTAGGAGMGTATQYSAFMDTANKALIIRFFDGANAATTVTTAVCISVGTLGITSPAPIAITTVINEFTTAAGVDTHGTAVAIAAAATFTTVTAAPTIAAKRTGAIVNLDTDAIRLKYNIESVTKSHTITFGNANFRMVGDATKRAPSATTGVVRLLNHDCSAVHGIAATTFSYAFVDGTQKLTLSFFDSTTGAAKAADFSTGNGAVCLDIYPGAITTPATLTAAATMVSSDGNTEVAFNQDINFSYNTQSLSCEFVSTKGTSIGAGGLRTQNAAGATLQQLKITFIPNHMIVAGTHIGVTLSTAMANNGATATGFVFTTNAVQTVGSNVVSSATTALVAATSTTSNIQVTVIAATGHTASNLWTVVMPTAWTTPATGTSQDCQIAVSTSAASLAGGLTLPAVPKAVDKLFYSTASGMVKFGSTQPYVSHAVTLEMAHLSSSFVVGSQFQLVFGQANAFLTVPVNNLVIGSTFTPALVAGAGWGSTQIRQISWTAGTSTLVFDILNAALTAPWATTTALGNCVNGVIASMQPKIVMGFVDGSAQALSDIGQAIALKGTVDNVYAFYSTGVAATAQNLEVHFKSAFELKVGDRIEYITATTGLFNAANAVAVTWTAVSGFGTSKIVNSVSKQTTSAGDTWVGEIAEANILAGTALGFTVATATAPAAAAAATPETNTLTMYAVTSTNQLSNQVEYLATKIISTATSPAPNFLAPIATASGTAMINAATLLPTYDKAANTVAFKFKPGIANYQSATVADADIFIALPKSWVQGVNIASAPIVTIDKTGNIALKSAVFSDTGLLSVSLDDATNLGGDATVTVTVPFLAKPPVGLYKTYIWMNKMAAFTHGMAAAPYTALTIGGTISTMKVAFKTGNVQSVTPGFAGAVIVFTQTTAIESLTVGDKLQVILSGWHAAGGRFSATPSAIGVVNFATLNIVNNACAWTSSTDTLECTLGGSGTIGANTEIQWEVTVDTNPSSASYVTSGKNSQCPTYKLATNSAGNTLGLQVSGLNSGVKVTVSNAQAASSGVTLSVSFTTSTEIEINHVITFEFLTAWGVIGGVAATGAGFPAGSTLAIVGVNTSTQAKLLVGGAKIPAGAALTFTISGCTNPAAGSYEYQVSTTLAPTVQKGASKIGIGQVTVSGGTNGVTMNNLSPGAMNTVMNVVFTLGATSALVSGDTISVRIVGFGAGVSERPQVNMVPNVVSTSIVPSYDRNTAILTVTLNGAVAAATQIKLDVNVNTNPVRGAYTVEVYTSKQPAPAAFNAFTLASELSAASASLNNPQNGATNTVLSLGVTTSGTIIVGDTIAIALQNFGTGIVVNPAITLVSGFGNAQLGTAEWNSQTNVLTVKVVGAEILAGSVLKFSLPIAVNPATPNSYSVAFSITDGKKTLSTTVSVLGTITEVVASISNNVPDAASVVTVTWRDSASLTALSVITVTIANFGGAIIAQNIATQAGATAATWSFPETPSTAFPTRQSDKWDSQANQLVVTLGTGATIAGKTKYMVTVPVAKNPAKGSYAVTVKSSGSQTPVQAANPIPIGGVTAVSVTLSNPTSGSTTSILTVSFTTPSILPIGSKITTVITGWGNALPAGSAVQVAKKGNIWPSATTLAGDYTQATGTLVVTITGASIAKDSNLAFTVIIPVVPKSATYAVTVRTTESDTPSAAVPALAIAGSVSGVTLKVDNNTPGAAGAKLTVTYTDTAAQMIGGVVNVMLKSFGSSISITPSVVPVSGFSTTTITATNYVQATGMLQFALATADIPAGQALSFTIALLTNPAVGSYSCAVHTTTSPDPVNAAAPIQFRSMVSGVTSVIDNSTPGATNTLLTVGFKDSSVLAVDTVVTMTVEGFGSGIPSSPVIVTVGGTFGATNVQSPIYNANANPPTITFKLQDAPLAANTPVKFQFTVTTNPNVAGCKMVKVMTSNSIDFAPTAESVMIGSGFNCVNTAPTPTPVVPPPPPPPVTDPLPPVTPFTLTQSFSGGGGSFSGSFPGNMVIGGCEFGFGACVARATIIDCSQYAGIPASSITVRLQMGSYVDHFRPAAGTSLCALLASTYGSWYEHSFDGVTWTVQRGDDPRLLGGGAPSSGRSAPVGPYWGALAAGMPAGGCGHAVAGDSFQCNRPFTMTVSVLRAFQPYAVFDGLMKISSSTYTAGSGNAATSNFVRPCGEYSNVVANNMMVRVTMGTYIDYFKPTASLCSMLTAPGQWYWHSSSMTGPWKAVNGNHSALLGGWATYAPDTRRWGTFWGAPDGPVGYHAEGGGCCENAPGAPIQFWRAFKIDVQVY